MAIADQLAALVAQRDKLGVKVDALVGGGGGAEMRV